MATLVLTSPPAPRTGVPSSPAIKISEREAEFGRVARDATAYRRLGDGWDEVAVGVWADEPVAGPLCMVFEECSFYWMYVNGGKVTELVQLWFS